MAEIDDRQKRKRVRRLQRYLINPPMKLLAWLGVPSYHVILETTGRKSGRPRRTVVGMHVVDGVGWVVAEQGTHAAYVRNIESDPDVRVRLKRAWRSARAEVIEDDDPQTRLDAFTSSSHAAAVRSAGTDLTSIRFDLTP